MSDDMSLSRLKITPCWSNKTAGLERIGCTAKQILRKYDPMINSQYKSYDDLPLCLNAKTVAEVLGIAQSSAYELMHSKDFPTVKVGSRMVVPKERFIEWVNSHADNPK